MAELDKLVIEISADDAKFIQSLATIRNGLKDFGATGTASAEQVAKALKAVEKAVLSTNDAAKKQELISLYNKLNKELVRTKKEFKELTKIIDEGGGGDNNLPRLNKDLKDVDQSARRARVALYGANQIVRDLPFGFIAISNNIPVFLDQFQSLVQETGSTSKAIKSLGGALIGAGGLSIAFSVASSAIVGLVQQYGSLANAINNVFDLVDKETLARIRLKEATAQSSAATLGDVSNIRLLIDTMLDSRQGYNERVNSYNELKRIAPGVLQDLSQENIFLGESNTLIRNRSEELIKYIVLKGRESALIKKVQEEEEKRLTATQKLIQQVTGEGRTWVDVLSDISEGAFYQNPVASLKATSKEIVNASKQTNVFATGLDKVRKSILALDGLVTGQVQDDTAKNEQDRLKKLAEEETKRKDAIKDRINEYEFELKQLQKTLNSTSEITKEYGRIKSKIIEVQAEIEKLKKPKLTLKIADQAKEDIAEVKTELKNTQFEAGRVRFTPIFDFNEETLKQLQKTIPEKIKIKGAELPLNIPPDLIALLKEYNLQLSLLKLKNEELKPVIDAVSNAIQNSFGNFIDSFIDGFGEGQSAIEAFQESLKELGKTILKELAKLALLAAIRAISESVAPGSGTASAGIAKRLLGAAAPANIGTGGLPVGPGGLAIRGNVTFVQRGQDLVGVLARSNARINRVG